MGVVDKNSNSNSEHNHRSNGSNSGGANSNGHPSEESGTSSSGEDDNEPGMRVGSEYQATVPELQPDVPVGRRGDSRPEALLVWTPSPEIPDPKLDEYISVAKEKFGYNTEQALGMLFWHKHSVEKSLADLPNFTPFPDEWTVEDRVLFEQAFSFHGKSFHRIRQMLPDKSISSLVRYYYQWKKTRTRTSLMDKKIGKSSAAPTTLKEGGTGGGDEEPPKEAEPAESMETDKPAEAVKDAAGGTSSKSVCGNCASSVTQLHTTPKGQLCNACYSYWRRTGVMRTHVGPVRNEIQTHHRHHPMRMKKKPPRGMYVDRDDLLAMATTQADAIFKGLDADIVNLKRQLQGNKQMVGQQKEKMIDIDTLRPPEPAQRNKSSWTNDEQLLAVQAIRKYGQDFEAVADVIGNKNAAQCRAFMVTFRRRFNLDKVLEEYDAERKARGDTTESPVSSAITQPSVVAPLAVPVISSAPPPLHRPTAAPAPVVAQAPASQKPPPLQTQPRFLHPRSALQQPPPLRPSITAISGPLARSRPPIMGPLSGHPPTLGAATQREPSPQ
ncbi:REST corepressor 1 [Strongylocentrotus purpuratus]|uniref:REST corepressor 3 n=1 Tax=Strongylocentrotus purpuratus TaxID=7668 RepID=A0A7M7R9Q6_STRPU|nr:REST corepressor 1 [Strongylocentrotus purpuratus]